MKLSDIIFEEVAAAEVGKATEELFQMLKQHDKAKLPNGQQVSVDGILRTALRDHLDSYLQKMGDRVTGIEGVELELGVPTVKFAYSEAEKASQAHTAQGQRDTPGKD